ncbi:MAG TPA: sigma 54-interacting transcriptional regulator [Polyangiaceae bacterium]|nr:sigma 54-interacting transcriptional regulator [Polyangiaceae bacterium]
MPPELTDTRGAEWRYRPLERVGRGGSASVWLARDGTGSRLALKVGHGAGERGRFAGEALRLALAVSPALPSLYDVGLVPATPGSPLGAGAPYLALEWVEGAALEPRFVDGVDRVWLALVVARDLGRALADLHAAGFAHGDVKPGNVLFDAGRGRARPVDLGLSELAGERRLSGATPRYLPPEYRGVGAGSDARARDLWALGVTLAELADERVAQSDAPAERALSGPLDERLEPLIRPLLRVAAGARPSAEWVHRRASSALGSEESAEERRARALASLRRAYLSTRAPCLERAACGDMLELRVTGLAEQWLSQAATLMRAIADLRGSAPRADRRRHRVDDLGVLDQQRLLVRLLGPAERPLRAATDAELLAELERSIGAQSPRHVEGLVLSSGARAGPDPESGEDDPLALAIASSEGIPGPKLLERAESYLERHPDARALGLVVARALSRGHQLGRALGVLDRLGGAEARAEAAEIARRAGDEPEAERRLGGVDWARERDRVRARAFATWARLALNAGDAALAEARLAAAPEDDTATLEVRAMLAIRARDFAGAERWLERARDLRPRAEELARLEFLRGRAAHGSHRYDTALACFARAADHAVRAGAVLEEATYLSGVAAAAADLGQLGQALQAAGRALVLYDFLGQPERAARAALSRASAFLVVGAREEAMDAAEEAARLGRRANDVRCQAYAALALAEATLAEPAVAGAHLAQARALAPSDGAADELRIEALALELGLPLDLAAADARATDAAASAEARLSWWGARARQVCRNGVTNGASSSEHTQPLGVLGRAAEVVQALALLVSAHASVGVRGPAFAAGARLAALLGDVELERRFGRLAREALATLRAGVPRELGASLELMPWAKSSDAAPGLAVAPEQVRDVDTLVRALTNRASLKSLLNQVLDALVLWTSVERGLLLLTAPGGRLVPRAARNLAGRDLTGAQLELSYSLAERAIATREPVVAVDAAGELPELHASVHALEIRSLLAIPLFFKGEILGVVYLDDRVRAGAFGPEELAWVRLVASIASVAIGDARDQLRLRRAARRAERAERKLADALDESEARRDLAERELARREEGSTRFSYQRIVGGSAAVQQLLALLDRVTTSEVPVLVLGESGTGKELVARALHENGPRQKHPFVSENCSAIPETLLESTLFGHVRGAFTGAARGHAGLFSVAHQGTLFLDEIGEMSLGMQAKLLRVLETGEVRPLGSEKSQLVDVRVIGATARDLDAMVRAGTFREDLFYRLNVVSVRVPPLRERRTDIVLLMRHFLAKYATGTAPTLSADAVSCLETYAWPGNVRELENEARRALVMAAEVIEAQHLSPRLQGIPLVPGGASELNVRARVDQLEGELVRTALDKTAGNQTRAAELLGLSRFGLQKMMKRLHIGRPQG